MLRVKLALLFSHPLSFLAQPPAFSQRHVWERNRIFWEVRTCEGDVGEAEAEINRTVCWNNFEYNLGLLYKTCFILPYLDDCLSSVFYVYPGPFEITQMWQRLANRSLTSKFCRSLWDEHPLAIGLPLRTQSLEGHSRCQGGILESSMM